ncbi:hypothetical protein B0A52_05807 [Exophiala mesophila]|uniref:SigF-like NTF2-like domain-containing protein n=1 Tax=Exophiala mesophila TaxID=212818 RepID=A0A438N2L9_EXOME|nr:hypothetical protein B0A52_05807 [Exophiala mesophila]
MEDPVTEIRDLLPILYTEAPDVQRNVVANYFTSDASFTNPFFRIQGFPGSIWSIHMIYRWCKVLSPRLKVGVESVAFDEENLLLYVSFRQNIRLRFVPFNNSSVKLTTVLQLSTQPDPQPAYDDLAIIEDFVGPDTMELIESDVASASSRPNHTKGKGQKKHMAATSNTARKTSEWTGNPYSTLTSTENPLTPQGPQPKVKYFIQSQNDVYQTDEWVKLLTPFGVGAFVVIVLQTYLAIFGILGTLMHEYVIWATQKFSLSSDETDDPIKREEQFVE